MTRIALIRHAQSEMNLHPELICGRSNPSPLSEQGRAAAVAKGRELAGWPRPDLVAASPAIRTQQTAQGLVDGAGWNRPIQIEPRIQELCQGQVEGSPRAKVWTPQSLQLMRHDPLGHRLAPGAENHREVRSRMTDALLDWGRSFPAGFVVATTHGVALRTLIWSLDAPDTGHEYFQQLNIDNLGIEHFEVLDGAIQHLSRTY